MPGADREPAYLSACRSAPHRAVAGLMAASVGDRVPKGLAADLAASPPEDLAAIANVNHIHIVLASAFERHPSLAAHVPEDLRIYFDEMLRANREINGEMRTQLGLIGGAFRDAGIRAVALKGSVELLAPAYADPDHRYISDCDLLVDPAEIERAVDLLLSLGGVMDPGGLDEANHHVAAITLPGAIAPIELHRRIGNGLENDLLPGPAVLENATLHDYGLLVPDPVTRLVHLIAHAQISHMRYDLHSVYLRDILDHAWMTRSFGPDVREAAAARFRAGGAERQFHAFEAVSDAVIPAGRRAAPPRHARRWAATTLHRFGAPGLRSFTEVLGWATTHARRFATSRVYRRRYFSIVAKRGLITTVIENLRTRDKGIK